MMARRPKADRSHRQRREVSRASFIRRLIAHEQWYERAGDTRAQNKPELVMLTAARYADPAISVDYLDGGTGQPVVRLSSKDRRQLEEFAEDLEAADVAATWMPIRKAIPGMAVFGQPGRLARSLHTVADAAATTTSTGPSLAIVIERMGHAAANFSPATEAASRTRAALAASDKRLTGQPTPAPF